MDTYQPETIEKKWQEVWEAERAFYAPNPEPGASPSGSSTCSRCSRIPRGRCTWGTSSTTRWETSSRITAGATGWDVLRPMGWDSFGLPAENAAIREGGHPREIVERNIAHIRSEMRRLGWVIDWDREISAHEPEYYRWTQWLFLKFFEAGLAYRKAAPVNWCPKDQTVVANEYVIDGKCERCGTPGRREEHGAVVLQDHGLRGPAARGSGADRLARADEDDPAQLDRTLGGRGGALPRRGARPGHPGLHDAAGHALRGDVLRRWRRSTRSSSSSGTTRCAPTPRSAAARSVEERQTKEKDGVFTGHHVVNPVNGERIPVWVADYVLMDYGTGAIMAVPAHDERDREFARALRPADPAGDRRGDRRARRLRRVHRAARRRGRRRRSSSGCARRDAARPRSATACATGRSRASATGAARSRSSTARTTAIVAGARGPASGCAARARGLPAQGQAAARRQRGVDQRAVPEVRQARAARGGHDGHVRRLVLVLPALLRPAQRPGAVGPAARRLLDAGRPVHRRHRPRDGAPALLALLREGAERLRPARLPRAVPAAVPPGLGAPRRDEDVEVEGERDRARRAGGHVRRGRGADVHPVHGPGRSGHGVERGRRRRDLALPPPPVADRERGRGECAAGRAEADRPDARRAPDDRAGDRRHRPPLPVQHADRGGDGARQRARALARRIRPRASPPRRPSR